MSKYILCIIVLVLLLVLLLCFISTSCTDKPSTLVNSDNIDISALEKEIKLLKAKVDGLVNDIGSINNSLTGISDNYRQVAGRVDLIEDLIELEKLQEKILSDDDNVSEETTGSNDIESELRNIIKDYIENTLEGQLTKFELSDNLSKLTISYNSKWSSEDIVKKEMFNVVLILSGSDYPDNYDLELTASGYSSGSSYKSFCTKEVLLKLHNYQMDYPEWLNETF